MSKTLLQLSIIVLLAFIVAGCEDEVKPLSTNSSAIDRISVGDLTFTLQMLNVHGQPQAQFAEGEDFQFRFIIENSSNEEYQLPVPWDFPVANDEFFALYRRTQESGNRAYIGKFFQMGNNFRDFKLVGIPGNTTIIYTIPWVLEKDSAYIMPQYKGAERDIIDRQYIKTELALPPLKAGEYYTEFAIQYDEKDSVQLKASFVIVD